MLLLHGCSQNAISFEGYGFVKNMIKVVRKNLSGTLGDLPDFYLEGMYDCPDGEKMWYPSNIVLTSHPKSPNYSSVEISDKDFCIEKTLDRVDAAVREHKISVLVGFSQGANVVDTYLRYHPNGKNIKVAILIAGFGFYDPKPKINSDTFVFSFHSKDDEIVPIQMCPQNYRRLDVVLYDGGHKFPRKDMFASVKF